jgi:hypothetical protein
MQAGKYKESAGLESCVDCSAHLNGSWTEASGSFAKSDCKCNKGFYGDASDNQFLFLEEESGMYRCASCPAGKYKDFVGHQVSGSSVSDLESDCQVCPPGTEAATECKNGKRSGESITETADCKAVKTKADCKTSAQKAECCVCGGGVQDYNPPAQTSCVT